jgi:outer membrane cobalamin receptor
MSNRLCVRRAVGRALFSAGALTTAGFSHVALAQETASPAASATEEVIVTGSRLRRDRDFVAVSPVQTIDLAQIQSSGNATLAELVNDYPQLVPDNTSVSNQSGGTGVLAANLRALGPVRTLVLVDGRRFIPANETGLTDLATIPDMLVERVEIVTGGASALRPSTVPTRSRAR